MILSVFICEDRRAQREFIEKTVTEYVPSEDCEIELAISTDDPTELLTYVETNPKKNSLYLLDVDLQHEIDGIALAKKIREHDVFGTIVFVTTHAELSYLVFRNRIEAMDYIIKDKAEDVAKKIRECIDLTYSRCKKSTKEAEYFQVKSSMGIQRIPIDDIMFFESYHVPHKLILHTQNELIEFRGALKEVIKISPVFFRCHKSYIVNTKNVKRVQRVGKVGEAEMINGAIALVGDTKIATLARIIMT